jgi:hypothetical protein
MPAIILLVAIGNQDAARLSGAKNRDDLIGLGSLEVRVDEVIATSIRRGNAR